jgi:serpin B
MKKHPVQLLILFIIISLLLPACGPSGGGMAQSKLKRVVDPVVAPSEVPELVRGNSAFAFDLYQAVRTTEGNLVYSPYSLSLAFAMTYAGARGETASQMANVLNYTLPVDQFHPAFNALDLDLARRPDQVVNVAEAERFQLSIANSLWGEKNWHFLPEYLDLLAENYGAGLRLVDFEGDPDNTTSQINEWISDQTKKRIQNIIPAGVIDADTRLVLVNAIYFKALWETSFNAFLTSESSFNLLNGGTTPVQMMTYGYDETFAYASGTGWQAISLPYKGGMNEMVIIVPDAGTFETFEAGLNPEGYTEILAALKPRQVVLSMPKFKFETPYKLKDIFIQMGMKDAFDPGKADFSGIDGARDLFIGAVLHKAFIAVDEKGTEAAAATVLAMPATVPSGVELSIDRPFFFFIRDIPSGTILFMGRVLNPVE